MIPASSSKCPFVSAPVASQCYSTVTLFLIDFFCALVPFQFMWLLINTPLTISPQNSDSIVDSITKKHSATSAFLKMQEPKIWTKKFGLINSVSTHLLIDFPSA